jgi:hypothetical protein
MMPPKKKMPINQSAYIIQNPMAVSAGNMKLIMARSAAVSLGQGRTSIARAFRHRIITWPRYRDLPRDSGGLWLSGHSNLRALESSRESVAYHS